MKNNLIRIFTITIFTSMFAFLAAASAKVNVVTSTPDLAAITKEIGKDKVDVTSLAKGYQDPHFVDAKPSYVLKLNRADLLVKQGLDLEIGWLPVLITGSRNSKISSKDASGYLDASTLLTNVLEVPEVPIDRSMGDIHPLGNPHYLLDPRNGVAVGKGIAERLSEIDPGNSSFYIANYEDFKKLMINKIAGWEQKLSGVKGFDIITYHKLWSYFDNWAGLKEVDTIELKPGIPPSPSHVAKLLTNAGSLDICMVIAANYYPDKTARVVAEKLGVPFVSLPASVGGTEDIKSYSDLFDTIVDRITSVSVGKK